MISTEKTGALAYSRSPDWRDVPVWGHALQHSCAPRLSASSSSPRLQTVLSAPPADDVPEPEPASSLELASGVKFRL